MKITDYIIENALILIPVLNVIGAMVKQTKKIPNKYIPLILLVFGLAGTLGICGLSASSAVQGVLVTGAAVYGHQIVKQLGIFDTAE